MSPCHMARRYIIRGRPAPDDQTLDELQGTALASEWLAATTIHIHSHGRRPARSSIESMLRPLRVLVAHGFVGRSAELNMLSDYAGVLPPSRRGALRGSSAPAS